MTESIADRLSILLSTIEDFCEEHSKEIPRLIAVSKTKPIEFIQEVYDTGHRDFGENYAKEMLEKSKQISDINWHFIGHLQRRHVGTVSQIASLIHAVDNVRVLKKLHSLDYKEGILIQVNISAEPSKYGVMPHEVPELVRYGQELGLNIQGLMCMSSLSWIEEEKINAFRRVAQIRDSLSLEFLSAGMSSDWREAILAGSTHLRIGTTIFGSRE